MNFRWALVTAGTLLSAAFLHTSASADQARKQTKTTEIRGYDYAHKETQPSTESLDLSMYARISEEGFNPAISISTMEKESCWVSMPRTMPPWLRFLINGWSP
jgi:hypothetical protein